MVVERVLSKKSIDYEKVGSYLRVRCLNPDHEDKNPSMFINPFTGWANCKSCGASYNIFKLFNETPNSFQIRKDKFKLKLNKILSDSTFYEIPSDAVLHEAPFKGISAETIKKFEAFQYKEHPGYLFFPLRNAQGKIVNFIGRDMDGDRSYKYMFMYKKPVLMAPYSEPYLGSVVLVEGIFDFLNLYQHGITNVRAIFGVSNFSQEHVDLLKVEGIDEVVILLDSDDAGRQGASKMKELLEENYISAKTISLSEGADPGSLSKNTIQRIKEKLYGSSNSRD